MHQTHRSQPEILAHCGACNDGQEATRLAGLLLSGMWDQLAPDDRGDFTQKGLVYDTPSGEAIFRWLCKIYTDRDADVELERRRATIQRRLEQERKDAKAVTDAKNAEAVP